MLSKCNGLFSLYFSAQKVKIFITQNYQNFCWIDLVVVTISDHQRPPFPQNPFSLSLIHKRFEHILYWIQTKLAFWPFVTGSSWFARFSRHTRTPRKFKWSSFLSLILFFTLLTFTFVSFFFFFCRVCQDRTDHQAQGECRDATEQRWSQILNLKLHLDPKMLIRFLPLGFVGWKGLPGIWRQSWCSWSAGNFLLIFNWFFSTINNFLWLI